METLRLSGRDFSLMLRIHDNLWCRIALKRGQELTELGAEVFEIFLDKLENAISDKRYNEYTRTVSSFTLFDKNVCWLATLSETLCSLYVTKDSHSTYIYILNREAEYVDTLKLTTRQCEQWMEKMSSWRLKIS